MVALPETRYAANGGLHVAYQLVGEGPVDVVLLTQWFSNIDSQWDVAPLAAFIRRLAAFGRVLTFDNGWACGGPRAPTAVVDARRSDVAVAIAWQAAAWPADLIVLTRRPRLAITRLVGGSVPDQVMRKASCPVLAVPPGQSDASMAGRH